MQRLATLLACAVALLSAAPIAHAAPRSCFWIRSADGFRALDDRTVLVRVNARDVYELSLFGPCLDLNWSERIALRARGSSWICEGSANMADVVVRSRIGAQRCLVARVHKLTAVELAALPRRTLP